MNSDIGMLHRLAVRDVFSHEAYDFTTWMERNPDALSNAVEIELVDVKREHNAGDFSVDLFAEDEDGHRVIIENQLEATDHKHLGQVLTYLSVLDADVAIWITADARPEHVSAVSWLNENATGADFYLVKVEGVRVDDSRAAPLFTRIVGPSAETRAAGQQKKELAEREQLRKKFFTGLLPISNAKTNRFANIAPKPRNHVSASAGHGFDFGYRLNEHKSRVFLYIHFGTRTANDAAFDVFTSHRDEIESAVGRTLEWVKDENRRRIIRYIADGGYRDPERWDSLHEDLAQVMATLEQAVESYFPKARRAAEEVMRQEAGGSAAP
jgi:hypothetical protein